MKEARCIGTSKLFDLFEETNLWYCPECDSLFNASKKMKGENTCHNCHKKIILKC